jgi:hypothetical protein
MVSPGSSLTGFNVLCKTESVVDHSTACSVQQNDALYLIITRKTRILLNIIVRKQDVDNILIGLANAVSPMATMICADFAALERRMSPL